MKNKLLTLLVALIVTFSLSYVVMAKTSDGNQGKKAVVNQEVVTLVNDSDLSLDEDSLILEPGEIFTITGTLEDEDLDIIDVDWEVDGDQILEIIDDNDYDDNQFEVTFKVIGTADDGDECTITFTVIDENNDPYEAECDITVDEDNGFYLDKTSLELEPGDQVTITGALTDDDLDIDNVEIDFDGDLVLEIIDDEVYDDNQFEVTFEVKDTADDGDECTITFTATDEDGKDYEETCEIVISTDEDDNEDDEDDNDVVDKEDKDNSPAAPAIANKILKANGIKNKNKETGVNYISQIAKQKGKGASFQGVDKNDNQDYEDAVRDYLEDELELDLDD